MSSFSAFMRENKIKRENVKFVASKDFVDENGKPIEWEIKQISNKEDESLKRMCTKNIKVQGRGNATRPELDTTLYMGKLAAACTVYPDLKNTELLNSYGVLGDDDLLKEMLSTGEYAEYCVKVTEVNGFDVDINDKIDEAKN